MKPFPVTYVIILVELSMLYYV